jgi:hypothetical protein
LSATLDFLLFALSLLLPFSCSILLHHSLAFSLSLILLHWLVFILPPLAINSPTLLMGINLWRKNCCEILVIMSRFLLVWVCVMSSCEVCGRVFADFSPCPLGQFGSAGRKI